MSVGWQISGLRVNPLFFIPESKCNILEAVGVRDTSDTVLAPAEGARPRHIVREVYQRISHGSWKGIQNSPLTAPGVSIMAV